MRKAIVRVLVNSWGLKKHDVESDKPVDTELLRKLGRLIGDAWDAQSRSQAEIAAVLGEDIA